MQPITDPRLIENDTLRGIALSAALVAKLDETCAELLNLECQWTMDDDVPEPADCPGTTLFELDEVTGEIVVVREGTDEYCPPELWIEDPVTVALSATEEKWSREEADLEILVSDWLAESELHWSAFRGLVFEPWQVGSGRFKSGTPRWVVKLGSLQAITSRTTPYTWKSWEPSARIRTSVRSFA